VRACHGCPLCYTVVMGRSEIQGDGRGEQPGTTYSVRAYAFPLYHDIITLGNWQAPLAT